MIPRRGIRFVDEMGADTAHAYLGLGGNLGPVAATIAEALRLLGETPGIRVVRRSGLYRTPPWGDTDQPAFVNGAALVETDLPPAALLERCLEVETALGRVRAQRWGPRTIDIDVLAYNDIVRDDTRLTLPHPRITERAFVLVPLAEIAPDLVIAGNSVARLLAQADATGIVPVASAAEEDAV